jgi:hypothetical protein
VDLENRSSQRVFFSESFAMFAEVVILAKALRLPDREPSRAICWRLLPLRPSLMT